MMNKSPIQAAQVAQPADDVVTPDRILDAARAQVRRFGEQKTNVVDIARALGTSHTTIYRHFRSKAEVFDAIVSAAMRDEEELASAFVHDKQKASERLHGLVLALHHRKHERFASDPEVYQLYRRVLEERPELVTQYAEAITRLIASILADGVKAGEFKISDTNAAAGVVRDAVTIFVHPAHVAAAARAGMATEPALQHVLSTLITAFKHGVKFGA